MNRLIEITPLLGEVARHHQMGERFRRGGEGINPMTAVLLSAALAVLLVAIVWISKTIDARQRKGYCSPRALFRELCSAHRLNRSSRHLLRRLARHHQLADPASVFVEPKLFDLEDAGSMPAARRDELISLRDRIFGTRLKTPGKPATTA